MGIGFVTLKELIFWRVEFTGLKRVESSFDRRPWLFAPELGYPLNQESTDANLHVSLDPVGQLMVHGLHFNPSLLQCPEAAFDH